MIRRARKDGRETRGNEERKKRERIEKGSRERVEKREKFEEKVGLRNSPFFSISRSGPAM